MNVSRLKNTLATIGLLIVFNIIHAQTDIIINRYRQYLINSVQPETDIKQAIASFSINHQWPDINYNDTARANWQVLNHLKRVRDLALAWTNLHSVYYGRNNIKETIHSGLDHWLDKRYKNSNWWHNEIG